MIFTKYFFLPYLIIFFFFGCSDNSVNSDNEDLPGLFVVDSFSTKIETHVHPENDSLSGSLSYNLRYHFENQPGTVQSLVIIIQDSIGSGINIDYAYPKPINETGYFSESLALSGFNLNSIDSIKFDIFVSGVFWDYNFETSKFNGFLGKFNWSESKWIQIPE